MNKKWERFVCILLACCVAACCTSIISAEEAAEDQTEPAVISIASVPALQELAEACRLDIYSQNLIVRLEKDLNLEGSEFESIPIFCGVFDGNHHTISGFGCRAEGSNQGLFRYLSQDAVVKNLKVEGTVVPGGSRSAVGGLAGCNEGTIENCTFRGEVGGSDQVGGITGINRETGILRQCRTEGTVHGDHFVGGIAGENHGALYHCVNLAEINATAMQNDVELSDITLDSLTKTESGVTVTDVGGIMGTNEGIAINCRNHATVGYQHMGYNIGGISGSQRGYLQDCINHGSVYGRKDVGGIVGQMEPVSKIEFAIDTLQTLQQQLTTMTALTNQAAVNAQNSAAALDANVSTIGVQSAIAAGAIQDLLPNPFDPELPTFYDIRLTHNIVSSSVSKIYQSMDQIGHDTKEAASNLASDLQALTHQINAMSQTISNTHEQMGGTITDVSDEDTAEDVTGKIESCTNNGTVCGDLNVGGIAGTVDWENDLDPEDDFKISGDQSMNFDSELRAVILDCTNSGTVQVKKQFAGGITGRLALGLIKSCINTGDLSGTAASYLGGIAGSSAGYLRSCSARCQLEGLSYVGGIAGSASIVTDCRSIAAIHGAAEKSGAILGLLKTNYKEVDHPISGNYYLQTADDPGGIDGVSYGQMAEPCTLREMTALSGVPACFSAVTIRFLHEDETVKTYTIQTGTGLHREQIPEVPLMDGQIGQWEKLDQVDWEHIYFDLAVEPSYHPFEATVQSINQREDGRAILLEEGAFECAEAFQLEKSSEVPALCEGETLLEAWTIPVRSQTEEQRLHYAAEPEWENLAIRLQDKTGSWREAAFTVKGSYLCFLTNPEDQAFAVLTSVPDRGPLLLGALIAAAVLLSAALLISRSRRKKNRKK